MQHNIFYSNTYCDSELGVRYGHTADSNEYHSLH